MADDPGLKIFPEVFVPKIQNGPYHPKWVRSNPGENKKWIEYRDAVIAGQQLPAPAMLSNYGKALIAAAEEHMTITRLVGTVTNPFPPDPAPAPGTGQLTWKSPTALGVMSPPGANLVEFTLSNATRLSGTLGSGAGRDLRLIQTEVLSGDITQLNNWRHIEWIGGEMLKNSGAAGGAVAVRNWTGIFHMEGVWLHGTALIDAAVFRSPETTTAGTIQIQNCRIEAHESGVEHADCIQFQQAKIAALRIDKCTFQSELQSCFMRVGGSAVDNAKNIELRRLNFRGTGDNAFWQNWEGGDATTTLKQIVPVSLTDVWIAEDGDTRDVGWRVIPRVDFYSGAGSVPPGFGGNTQWSGSRRGNFVATDATSQYCYFSDGTQLVPSGASAGQQTLDCQISGVIRKGIPPGGDFVPDPAPGLGYVSPGYV